MTIKRYPGWKIIKKKLLKEYEEKLENHQHIFFCPNQEYGECNCDAETKFTEHICNICEKSPHRIKKETKKIK